MPRTILLALLLSLVSISACAPYGMQASGVASTASRLAMSEAADEGTNATGERMIIRTAALTIEVGDVNKAQESLKSRLGEYRGYASQANIYSEDSSTVTYRVDSKRLDDFIAEVKQLGHVRRESVSSQDVTEQYVDFEARLKNLVLLRDRVRGLLEKTSNVEELLKVERELARIQSEIDSFEAQLRTLKQAVDLSDVTVTFVPRTIYGPLGYVAKGVAWFVEKLFVIRH